MLLPKHRIVERGFAWTRRLRRLARDDELFAEKGGKRPVVRIQAFEDTWKWNIESGRAFWDGVNRSGG